MIHPPAAPQVTTNLPKSRPQPPKLINQQRMINQRLIFGAGQRKGLMKRRIGNKFLMIFLKIYSYDKCIYKISDSKMSFR